MVASALPAAFRSSSHCKRWIAALTSPARMALGSEDPYAAVMSFEISSARSCMADKSSLAWRSCAMVSGYRSGIQIKSLPPVRKKSQAHEGARDILRVVSHEGGRTFPDNARRLDRGVERAVRRPVLRAAPSPALSPSNSVEAVPRNPTAVRFPDGGRRNAVLAPGDFRAPLRTDRLDASSRNALAAAGAIQDRGATLRTAA